VAKGQRPWTWSGTINANTIGVQTCQFRSLEASHQGQHNGTGSHTTLIRTHRHQTNESHLPAGQRQHGGGQCARACSMPHYRQHGPNTPKMPQPVCGLDVDVGALASTNNIEMCRARLPTPRKKNDFSAGDPSTSATSLQLQGTGATISRRAGRQGGGPSHQAQVTQVIRDDNLNPATTTVSVTGLDQCGTIIW